MKYAVIVIDMLNDFVTGNLKCDRAQRIIPNIKRLIDATRKYDIPVIFSNDAHEETDFEVVKKWGKHAMKGTKGAEVIPELKLIENDFIVPKKVYSGFYETGLEDLLKRLHNGKGADTLVLTGLHTHMCVRHTAADAFFRGFNLIIPEDGVEAFSEGDHKQGLEYFENYAAEVTITDKIIERWKEEIKEII